MLERHNYICLFYMKLDLILLRDNFFSKAKFHNNKYCRCNWQNWAKHNNMSSSCLIQQSFSCIVAGTGNFPPPLIQEWGLGYKIYNLHCIDSIWVLVHHSLFLLLISMTLSYFHKKSVWHILLLIKQWKHRGDHKKN